MAKYAQGYERKNSDSKNLIIMASIIVGVVVVAIVAVILCNKFVKKEKKDYSTYKTHEVYSKYYLDNFDELLDQEEKDYCIYVVSSSSTADKNMKTVIQYLEDYENGKIQVKMFLLDYDDFDNTSDDTEKSNSERVTEALGESVSAGNLFGVHNNKIADTSTQVVKNAEKVENAINALLNNKEALEFNK